MLGDSFGALRGAGRALIGLKPSPQRWDALPPSVFGAQSSRNLVL
jgi:hypothetical protein